MLQIMRNTFIIRYAKSPNLVFMLCLLFAFYYVTLSSSWAYVKSSNLVFMLCLPFAFYYVTLPSSWRMSSRLLWCLCYVCCLLSTTLRYLPHGCMSSRLIRCLCYVCCLLSTMLCCLLHGCFCYVAFMRPKATCCKKPAKQGDLL